MKAIEMLILSAILAFSTSAWAIEKTARVETNIDRYGYQPQNWEKLGSRVVNMQIEQDEIMATIRDGVFTKVRLKIMKVPIHLLSINIVFGNGENKNVVFNKKFAAGSFTRVIDLPGNKRIIKKVRLNYKSVPVGKGRAVVTLFGRRWS